MLKKGWVGLLSCISQDLKTATCGLSLNTPALIVSADLHGNSPPPPPCLAAISEWFCMWPCKGGIWEHISLGGSQQSISPQEACGKAGCACFQNFILGQWVVAKLKVSQGLFPKTAAFAEPPCSCLLKSLSKAGKGVILFHCGTLVLDDSKPRPQIKHI